MCPLQYNILFQCFPFYLLFCFFLVLQCCDYLQSVYVLYYTIVGKCDITFVHVFCYYGKEGICYICYI